MAAVTFTYSTYTLELEQPNLGYKIPIELPFDFVNMDNGAANSFDYGGSYDRYSCECEWVLDATTAELFLAFFNTDARGQSAVMTLTASSGFFPFGPHRGDVGAFTVAVEILNQSAPLNEPYQWYSYTVRLTKSGSFPAYTIPTEVKEGSVDFVIAGITGVRMPPNGFSPAHETAISVNFSENNTAFFVDKTSVGDARTVKFTLESNQTKVAKILKNIIDLYRTSDFTFYVPVGFDPFGFGSDSAALYTVCLLSPSISVTHEEYNHFSLTLSLLYKGTS